VPSSNRTVSRCRPVIFTGTGLFVVVTMTISFLLMHCNSRPAPRSPPRIRPGRPDEPGPGRGRELGGSGGRDTRSPFGSIEFLFTERTWVPPVSHWFSGPRTALARAVDQHLISGPRVQGREAERLPVGAEADVRNPPVGEESLDAGLGYPVPVVIRLRRLPLI